MNYHQELLDEIVALKEQVARWRQDANRWEARYNELLEELALVVQSSVSETIDYYGEFEEEYIGRYHAPGARGPCPVCEEYRMMG